MTVNGLGRPRLITYQRLATLYQEALDLGLPPVTTIADILDITHKAAERRLHRLRQHGYLPRGNMMAGQATSDPARLMASNAGRAEAEELAVLLAPRAAAAAACLANLAKAAARRDAQAQARLERRQREQARRPTPPPRRRILATLPTPEPVRPLDVFPGDWM